MDKEGQAPSSNIEQKVNQALDKLAEKPIIQNGLNKLREQLPANLKYHAFPHTPDVLHDAIYFALDDGVEDEHSLQLLGIASVYHDMGYIEQYPQNEEIGARMAVAAMREAGYPEEDINIVDEGIKDTQVDFKDGHLQQRTARNDVGRYLLDADVSNFGRVDFRDKSQLIIEELQAQGNTVDPPKFLKATLDFLTNHQWQTQAAKNARQNQKDINILNLQQELAA